MTKVPTTTPTTTIILLGPRCFATRGQKVQKNQIQVRKIRDIRLAKATLAIIAFCNLHQVLIFTLFFSISHVDSDTKIGVRSGLAFFYSFSNAIFPLIIIYKGKPKRVLKAVFFWPSFVTSPSLLPLLSRAKLHDLLGTSGVPTPGKLFRCFHYDTDSVSR